MATSSATSPLTRKKLSELIKDPELIIAFDKLFRSTANVSDLEGQIQALTLVVTAQAELLAELQALVETSRFSNL